MTSARRRSITNRASGVRDPSASLRMTSARRRSITNRASGVRDPSACPAPAKNRKCGASLRMTSARRRSITNRRAECGTLRTSQSFEFIPGVPQTAHDRDDNPTPLTLHDSRYLPEPFRKSAGYSYPRSSCCRENRVLPRRDAARGRARNTAECCGRRSAA